MGDEEQQVSVRRVRPAEDDEDEVQIEVRYTNEDPVAKEAYSIAKRLRAPGGPDKFS